MDGISSGTTLQSYEDDRAHNRDEVEGQVHNIANECLRGELLERRFDELAELLHWIIKVARLQLTAFRENTSLSARDQDTIKCIHQGIL